MSANDNTSTLKSYVDSAAGTLNSGIAALTGQPGDQAKADEHKAKADLESDASHTAAKAGPFTLGSSGGVAKDNPDRGQGAWNQTVGSGKETLGNIVGSEALKRDGREQNLQGQGQEAKGQLTDLGQGVGERVQGTVGGAVAGLAGDRDGAKAAERVHDDGKARQRGAELDIQKQS